MLLAEIALRTGIPQHKLADRFTIDEIRELVAYKNIEFKSTSKEDTRFALLAYHTVTSNLAAAGGKKAIRGIKPDTFVLKWGKNVRENTEQTKEQIEEALKAVCLAYGAKEITQCQNKS